MSVFLLPGVVGDGVHDDTIGIQTALDKGWPLVSLPPTPAHYLIRRPLRIHSRQTLMLDRFTMIRLADRSDCPMLANADPAGGNQGITVIGGIWNMANLSQSLCEYQQTQNWQGAYDPERYLGVLMRFDNVTDLCLRGLTLKDPVTFGTQLGNLDRFTIEDITFDYNLQRTNMDGIHVHGNSRQGRIANLKGATNDDLVALNADDGGMFEMSRGPIEDVSVEDVFSQDGYTAVRLLSAGSPLRRVRLANLFGTYRHNVVSFTNHRVHPGSASTFEDVSIQGVFCSKSGAGAAFDPADAGWSGHALIWVDAPAVVSSLVVSDFHRTERVWPAGNIVVEPGATVESLQMSDVSVVNHTPGRIPVLTNRGTIGALSLRGVYAHGEGGRPCGPVVENAGQIHRHSLDQVFEDQAPVE